jgi:hypothetical protein
MALQGEYVRLYCTFEVNGRLADPSVQPVVTIVDSQYYQESSSSSSLSASSANSLSSYSGSLSLSSSSSSTEDGGQQGWGPFYARKESTGIWYIDWFVDPTKVPVGTYYDIWRFQWSSSDSVKTMTFPITVLQADKYLNYTKPAVAQAMGDCVPEMLRELNCSLLYEAQHIPNYWEQGYRTDSYGSPNTTLNFAYQNWNDDPRPLLRRNGELMNGGWTPDMMGTIKLGRPADPEDHFFARYFFRYFSDECLMTFLNEGLYMMNATPPASMTYGDLCSAPFAWRAGIMLYASMQALRRIVFGVSFQERAIIYGEDPARAQEAAARYQQLYSDYMTLWMEIRKDSKTKVLPAIFQISTPEYTLPGGRSRWFRYLYK